MRAEAALIRDRLSPHLEDRQVTLGGFIVNEVGDGNEMVVDKHGNITATSFIPTSSRRTKHDFESVDRREILARLVELPITEWSFEEDAPGVRHLGPFAEDFHQAFGLNGDDPSHFNLTDTQGVALAAIQALNDLLTEKDAEIHDLEERLAALEGMVAELAPSGARAAASSASTAQRQ